MQGGRTRAQAPVTTIHDSETNATDTRFPAHFAHDAAQAVTQ
jgi:hypothetical protein